MKPNPRMASGYQDHAAYLAAKARYALERFLQFDSFVVAYHNDAIQYQEQSASHYAAARKCMGID